MPTTTTQHIAVPALFTGLSSRPYFVASIVIARPKPTSNVSGRVFGKRLEFVIKGGK